MLASLLAVPKLAGADGTWGETRLPGGVAAAWRILGWSHSGRTAAGFLIDLARFRHGVGVSSESVPPSIEELAAYLEHLSGLHASLLGLPNGLALPASLAQDRSRRDLTRNTLEFLGLRLVSSRNRFQAAVDSNRGRQRFAVWAAAVGIDAKSVAERLNRGETVTLAVPSDTLPLPLPDLWKTVTSADVGSANPFVTDSRALLLYMGLMAMDWETLEWFTEHPRALRQIYNDRAIPWAAFGRAFRVRAKVVHVPGGAAVQAIWEDLVDAPVSDPERFLARLLERDEGRLAYFFDCVTELDEAHRNFALGQHLADPAAARDRIRFVRRVYDRFAGSVPQWNLSVRPMYRPEFDAALALSSVEVLADGTIGPDWWPGLLDRLANESSWRSNPNDTMRALRPTRADAAWFLEWVFDKPLEAHSRFVGIRFMQRNFTTTDRALAPVVEVAGRALQEMPALALALERMGVREPRVFETVARAAKTLNEAGDPDKVIPALRAWQGGLAMLEQLVRHGALKDPQLTRLLLSLSAAAPARLSDPTGVMAAWFFDELLPATGVAGIGNDLTESTVLAGLLGAGKPSASTLRWEGIDYRLDLVGPAATSAAAIRRVTPGPHLEHLIALRAATSALAEGIRSLEQLAGLIKSLEPLPALVKDAVDGENHPTGLSGDLDDAIKRLRRIRTAKDLPRATRERATVMAVLDHVVSVVTSGFAYALAFSPTMQPPRIYADGPASHDFGVGLDSSGKRRLWRRIAWSDPHVTPRVKVGGTMVTGALVGLDLARAPDRLLRVGMPEPPSGAVVPDPEVNVLTERAAVRTRSGDWEADGRAIAGAVARGRALVEQWNQSKADPRRLAIDLEASGLSAWRSNLFALNVLGGGWAAATAMLTPTDFYRLGTTRRLPAAWGQIGRSIDGCWCLLAPSRGAIDRNLGRQSGALGVGSHELAVRMSVLLAEMGLPQALLEPMLPMAIQDALDRIAPFGFSDWEAFAWAKALTRDRVDDYLQGLVAQRILTATGGDSPVAVQR